MADTRFKKQYLEIDEDALEEARSILETSSIKDTVNTALLEVAQRLKRLRAYDQLRQMGQAGEFDHLLDKSRYRAAAPDWSPYAQDDASEYDSRQRGAA